MTIYKFKTENQSAYITTKDVNLLYKMANADEMFHLLNKTFDFMNDPEASSFDADKLNNEILTLIKTINSQIDANI